jgi:hypothetical protein
MAILPKNGKMIADLTGYRGRLEAPMFLQQIWPPMQERTAHADAL